MQDEQQALAPDGTIAIERKDSPNRRYAYTISFVTGGKWYAHTYTHTLEQAHEVTQQRIDSGVFPGPVILI